MGFLDERANLAGKVAIVVGGGGGLGRASALDLGRAGVRLALCDRNAELLAATVATLEELGADVISSAFDARDPDALAAFFDQVDEAYGDRLDVLVNIVGGTRKEDFAGTVPKAWDSVIRTNFTYLLHSTHLAIPRMRRAGGGSIINMTSIEAHRAAPGFAVYAGMKAAASNFGRSIAVELAHEGIRVNTIAPDMIPTEGIMAMGASMPARAPGVDDLSTSIAIPMARKGDYEDVGSCVLFLASDLSRFVTGTALHPDGGTYASSGWFHWPEAGYSPAPPTAAVEAVMGD